MEDLQRKWEDVLVDRDNCYRQVREGKQYIMHT